MMRSLTLFSGLALRDVFEDRVIPRFVSGREIEIVRVYEPTSVLLGMIRDGARPDVIVGVTSSIEELVAAGDVVAASVRGLVRSDVGVAVAIDSDPIAWGSVDDLRALLQRVSSVAYSRAGASGGVFRRVLEDLGLMELVESKSLVLASGFTAEAVRDGRAEIAVQQLSELASVEGVDIIGSLPAELRAYVELSLAVGASSESPEVAGQLCDHLRDEESRAVYRQAYLDPMP